MLTGARRAEIAGLAGMRSSPQDDGSKAIVLPPARTKTGARPSHPGVGEALKVIAECSRRRVVGCPYVLTSDGHRAFANFNRVKDWLDEALERRRRFSIGVCTTSGGPSCRTGGEAARSIR